ncbi:transcriptional regulator of sorbose uptake and utilization genes [Klebsiella variicola]|nr:transcriptional regulator of sorbose uptake and utilization genes [Klebsiella variicola]
MNNGYWLRLPRFTIWKDESSLISPNFSRCLSHLSPAPLARCQKEGVVKISVVQPSNIFLKLEKGLEDRYGLKQAVVVDTEEEASDHTIKRAIGSAAAHYLETRLRPKI